MAREFKVPSIGDFEGVEVIDVLVKEGDRVSKEDSLITLESDKAAMDVPASFGGTIREIKVKVGDSVSEGDVIAVADPEGAAEERASSQESRPAGGAPLEAETGHTMEQPMEAKSPPTNAPAAAKVAKVSPRQQDAQDDESIKMSQQEADESCDILVLGAGPGGYTAAFRAADLGRDVILVDARERLGGVCLNVGCIPSKALLHAAEVIEQAREMGGNGIEFGAPQLRLDALRGFEQKAVERLTSGLAQMAKQRNVRLVSGRGRFVSPYLLEVDDGQGKGKKRIAFRQAIIAAGSEPLRLPGQPDDPRIMDSTGALELAEVPKRLLVVGGGVIGLEMAQAYSALGAAVSVVELTDTLMPGADLDLIRILERRLKKAFEAIHVSTKVTELKPQKNGILAKFSGPGGDWGGRYGRVLVAIGRRPNGHVISAGAAGVSVNDTGFVSVDSQMRTNVSHIFAIGDIAGPPLLAHKASHEGKVAAEAACGKRSHFDVRAIPSVAYTHPEVAWAGLTETEAKQKNVPVTKAVFPWQANGRALTLGVESGTTKLLFEKETGRLVGAGIVGPNAGELIAELVLAIEMGCDAEDLALSVHPHPTLSETVGMAAEVAAGTITDLYIPSRRRPS